MARLENDLQGGEERKISTPAIYGTGEMAGLTRAFAWEKSSLGPIEQWHELLVTTVSTLLSCKTPMFLYWDDDLSQFYNDAYRPSLGSDKYPGALGQRGRDCLPLYARRRVASRE